MIQGTPGEKGDEGATGMPGRMGSPGKQVLCRVSTSTFVLCRVSTSSFVFLQGLKGEKGWIGPIVSLSQYRSSFEMQFYFPCKHRVLKV